MLDGQVLQHSQTGKLIVDVPTRSSSSPSSPRSARRRDRHRDAQRRWRRPQAPGLAEPGDVFVVTIEGVGTLRNRVVAEPGDRSGWRWRPGPSPGGLLAEAHRCPWPGRGHRRFCTADGTNIMTIRSTRRSRSTARRAAAGLAAAALATAAWPPAAQAPPAAAPPAAAAQHSGSRRRRPGAVQRAGRRPGPDLPGVVRL